MLATNDESIPNNQRIQMCKQLIKKDPNQPSAWFNLGLAYHEQGSHKKVRQSP